MIGFGLVTLFVGAVAAQKLHSKAKYIQYEAHGLPLLNSSPTLYTPNGKQHTTTRTCPEGFWLDREVCLSKQEIEAASVCPPQTADDMYGCLSSVPARMSCPEGSVLVAGDCMRKERCNKRLSCPAGFTLNRETCVITFDLPPSCPQHTSGNGDSCASITPVENFCSNGFSLFGNSCGKTEFTEPIHECPAGFNRQGNVCVFTAFLEPVCPIGTVDQGSSCVSFSPKEARCQEGFIASGADCIKVTIKPKQSHCFNGANPDDKCRIEVPLPLTAVCPEPSRMVEDHCYVVHAAPALYSCPDGYEPKSGRCGKSVDYDCSVTTHRIECDAPATNTKGLSGVNFRGLFVPMFESKARHVEKLQQIPQTILPVCREIPVVTPKTCQKDIFADGSPFCSKGVYKGSNVCEITEAVAPVYLCKGKSGEGNRCFIEETCEPTRSCPSGFTSNDGESCARREFAAPAFGCPAGTQPPTCSSEYQKVCPEKSCERKLVEPAAIVCPPSFVKGDRGGKVICSRVVYQEVQSRCPPNTHQEGTVCVGYLSKGKQSEMRSMSALRICPPGFADAGNDCVMDVVSPPTPLCPEKYIYDSVRCTSSVPKSIQCPKGSVQEKGKCWVFRRTDPLTVDTVVPTNAL